jgi:two-component system nitrate/nitrite sensor histidine kinase NarX
LRIEEDVITSRGSSAAASTTSVTPVRDVTGASVVDATSAAGQGPWSTSLRRWVSGHLKLISVVLPLTFFVLLELVRYDVNGGAEPPHGTHRLIFLGVTIAAIVAFALAMFRLIERAEHALVLQNRDLAATNDAAGAIHAEMTVEGIVGVALDTIFATSSASQASVVVYGRDAGGTEEGAASRTTRTRGAAGPGAPEGPVRPADPTLDMPLVAGNIPVGRLEVWFPTVDRAGGPGQLGTIRSIGHHLGTAIQIAELFADLNRRKNEGHAFYDILLQISHHAPSVDILGSVVRHARDRLASDAVVLTLTDEAARAVQFGGGQEDALVSPADAARFEAGLDGVDPEGVPWADQVVARVNGPMADLGGLWVARRAGDPYTDRDEGFLATLAGFAAIAITSAQLRENGRHQAILDERERIAREMHDSLAQVLGSVHLRLRVLEGVPSVEADEGLAREVSDLAATCHEAYLDVREAILGLRDASKAGHGLEEILQTYLAKYSRQSGITALLDNRLDRRLTLSPPCEVHIIRVVQEALTNARKHSGATQVVVRITEDGAETTFVVEDDGHGFDQAAQRGEGYGLFTMRDRMALLHGSLAVDSVPGRGTRVIASVPERSRPCPVIIR